MVVFSNPESSGEESHGQLEQKRHRVAGKRDPQYDRLKGEGCAEDGHHGGNGAGSA